MALIRKHPRQNNSRAHIWEELEALDSRISTNTVEWLDNTGAVGLTTVLLPTAVRGLEYVIERVATQTYRIQPDGAEYFQGALAGAYKSLDSDGAYINIKCLQTGTWHVMAQTGTVTDE